MINGGAGQLLRQCIRCSHTRVRSAVWTGSWARGSGPIRTGKGEVRQFTRSAFTATGRGVHVLNPAFEGSSPAADPETDVWSKMQKSPKRQCILTSRTLPSDYLIKLKARYYPPSDVEAEIDSAGGKGGNYLIPSLVADEAGRSWYVTLHQDFLSRLHSPGPHSWVLHQNDLSIPRRMDEWIRTQLAAKLINELALLVKRLRAKTPRMKNLPKLTGSGSGQGQGGNGTEENPVVRTLALAGSDLQGSDSVDCLIVRLPRRGGLNAEMIREAATTEVDLSNFPAASHAPLFEVVEQLRLIDRKHTLRQAILAKSDLSAPHLRHVIGRPIGGGYDTLVLSSSTPRGQLAIPAMTALLRWKLYNGQGWERNDTPVDL